tara:strand:- start:9740 stop:11797 length:2058 start_codon:yes stop_codon:yes gene_type:complete
MYPFNRHILYSPDGEASGPGSSVPEGGKESFISRQQLRDLRLARDEQKAYLSSLKDQKTLMQEIDGLSSDTADHIKKEIEFANQKTSTLRTQNELSAAISETSALEKKIANEIAIARFDGHTALVDTLKEQDKSIKLTKKQQKEQEKLRTKLDKKMGILDNIADFIKTIPGVGGATKKLMDSIIVGQEKAILANKNRIVAFAKSIKVALSEVAFGASMAIIGMAIFRADKQIASFQKNLGISAVEAGKIKNEFYAVQTSIAVTSLEFMKTITALNAQLGLATTSIRGDIVSEMAKLGKLTGLSAQSQAQFAMFAQKSGMHAEKLTDEARATIVANEGIRGVRMDINKIMDEAGKISGVVRANLGYNVIAITDAISAAKQFGMTLSDLEGVSKNLLNFQSSIEAELTAELFTGKQLNLEKARLYALTANYKGLAGEISRLAGGELEFARMNVLEKQKYADALGMSVDKMSDLVYQNANLAELAQEARDAGDKELANSLERRSVGESFRDIMYQLKQIFVDLMTPLLPVLEAFSQMLQNSDKLQGILKNLSVGGLYLMSAYLARAAAALIIGSGALAGWIGAIAAIPVAIAATKTISDAGKAQKMIPKSMPRYNNLEEGTMVHLQRGPAIADPGETIVRTESLAKSNSAMISKLEELITVSSQNRHVYFDKYDARQGHQSTKFGYSM